MNTRLSSTIEFVLPETESVPLRFFDMTDKVLQSWYSGLQLDTGMYQVEISGEEFTEGIYFIQLQTSNKSITHKWSLIQY